MEECGFLDYREVLENEAENVSQICATLSDAILKHNEMSYMDFIKTCKDIEEREGTKDLYTVKALLVQEYNFEELVFMGGYEVTKRKGAL